jgi:hypothetical protein
MNEKQKKKKLFEYIVKYNDRNTDKIKWTLNSLSFIVSDH